MSLGKTLTLLVAGHARWSHSRYGATEGQEGATSGLRDAKAIGRAV